MQALQDAFASPSIPAITEAFDACGDPFPSRPEAGAGGRRRRMTAELWGGPVVGDVRTWVDGSTTVQVWGLDAKATEVAATQFELGMLVADGLRSAGDALTDWRGVHAETFVDDANDLFVRLVSVALDWLLQQLDVDAVDAFDRLSDAEKVDRVRRAESNIDRAVWVAVDRFASDPTVHAAALGQPFVNDDGTLKTDMSPQEMQAFREWATSLVGSDRDPGPLWEDEDDIDAGQSEATSPEHSITIEGRQ